MDKKEELKGIVASIVIDVVIGIIVGLMMENLFMGITVFAMLLVAMLEIMLFKSTIKAKTIKK